MAALVGGVTAGLLFSLLQTVYVVTNVGVAKFDVLFGGVAFLPLLIVFVYAAWAVVLLGSEVSFAFQNVARYRREVRGTLPQPATREAIGLGIAVEVARRFGSGADPVTADDLADALDVRIRTVREILQQLEDAGILSECAADEPSGEYQLGRAAETVRIADVMRALRGSRAPLIPAVDRVLEEAEKRQAEVVDQQTLADLVRS